MIRRLSRVLNEHSISAVYRHCIKFNSQISSSNTSIIDVTSRPFAIELSRSQYHKLSENVLQSLLEKLESFIENTNISGSDVEYSSGVLTLNLGKYGIFVVNKQPPNQQIWLSSPISGPKRFDYCGQQHGWFSLRDQVNLFDLIHKDLGKIANTLLE